MKKKGKAEILQVQICDVAPNPLFTEDMRRIVRFLRFNRWIPCKECGKKRKVMWTMLCQFRVITPNQFTFTKSKNSFEPLTPVCSDHPLQPDWPEEKDGETKEQKRTKETKNL